MKKRIPFSTAKNATIAILLLVTLFNLLVMAGIVPYNIVWGGRLQNTEEMIAFELVSIIINLLIIFIVLLKAGRVLPSASKLAYVLAWLLPIIYFFGILGNLASTSPIERALFVPVTLLLFTFTLRIALEKTTPAKK